MIIREKKLLSEIKRGEELKKLEPQGAYCQVGNCGSYIRYDVGRRKKKRNRHTYLRKGEFSTSFSLTKEYGVKVSLVETRTLGGGNG